MSDASPEVVLASGSPRRRELLTLIGIPHRVQPADIDERVLPEEAPAPHCERLALEKATVVARSIGDGDRPSDSAGGAPIVLAADTIVVVDGDVLGKPRDADEARGMLRRLSGRTHTVHTAVAAVRGPRAASRVDTVAVAFRALSDAEIDAYVATGEPMDKAGAYGIQGYGAAIVRRVDGDFFAVMGLGLVTVVELLRELGIGYESGRGLHFLSAPQAIDARAT